MRSTYLALALFFSAGVVTTTPGCLTTDERQRQEQVVKTEADLKAREAELARREAELSGAPIPDAVAIDAVKAERAKLAAELTKATADRKTLEEELRMAKIQRGLAISEAGVGFAQTLVGFIPGLMAAAPLLAILGSGIQAMKAKAGGTTNA